MEIVIITAIATAVYTILEIVKKIVGENETFSRFIPLIACVLGATSGELRFYFILGVVTADNIALAIIVGAARGLSTTGADQVVKQLAGKRGNSLCHCQDQIRCFSYMEK